MTAEQAKLLTAPTAGQTQFHTKMVETWARQKKWSRTDSARFLNERSEALLARFRRVQPSVPVKHSAQFGYWLRTNAPTIFERAHGKLTQARDDAGRERLLPTDFL